MIARNKIHQRLLKLFCSIFLMITCQMHADTLVKEMFVTKDSYPVSFSPGFTGVLVYQETEYTGRIVGMIFREDKKMLFCTPKCYDSRQVKVSNANMLEFDILELAISPSVEQTLRIYDFGFPIDVTAKCDGFLHGYVNEKRFNNYIGNHIHVDLSWIHSAPEEYMSNRLYHDGSCLGRGHHSYILP